MIKNPVIYVGSRRLKLMLALLIGVLFLVVTNYFIINQQRDRMTQDSRQLMGIQMDHLQDHIKSFLQDGNYQSADRFLQNWGDELPDIASLKLIARNGSVLSEFTRKVKADRFVKLERTINYSYKGQARLVLMTGLGYVDREVSKLLWLLIFISSTALVVYAALVNEILHRRRMEDEVRKSNEQLENNIYERTTQLRHEVEERKSAEENLLIAKDNAENATRAKSKFLANMSHELRTPLNAILGYSEAMIMETFGSVNNKKYDEYIQIIHDSGNHLLGLINEILDISAIEAGKLELNEELIDVEDVIKSMIMIMEPRIEKKQQQISCDCEHDLPALFADRQRIKQIVLNLLSNASRYTPENGQIRVETSSCEKNCICFSISDTGVGISPENIKTALEPFGQIHDPSINEKSGTGLGLPLVKSLVEIHGGTLGIDSVPNGGTTITVKFPAERTVQAA